MLNLFRHRSLSTRMGSAESKAERIARRIAERCISHEKNMARQLSKEENEMHTKFIRYQALYKRNYLTEHYVEFHDPDCPDLKYPDLNFYVDGAYTFVVSSDGAKVWEVLYWDLSVAVSSSCRFDGSKKCWYIHQVVVDCA